MTLEPLVSRREVMLLGGSVALLPTMSMLGLGATPRRTAPATWPAPPLRDLQDGLPRLAAREGSWRAVHFWARWCAPCRRELPALQRLAPMLREREVQLWTVALDDDDFGLREYLAQRGLTLPVLRPMTPEALVPLALTLLPQTWLIAPDGRVTLRWPGERDWDATAVRAALSRALP